VPQPLIGITVGASRAKRARRDRPSREQPPSPGHQQLAQGLEPVAWAEDGTIEGIEAPGRTWLLAVQFHPEDLVDDHLACRRLFDAFVEACRAR